ncbi:MAG: hypothetical protein AAB729_05445, partial [Patescibacteria group bacterium]
MRNLEETGYVSNDYGLPGDELYVRIYVHNGAQQGLDSSQTTAFGVNGSFSISGNTVSTSFSGTRGDGSVTNTVNGSVTIDLPEGGNLEIVPNSGQFFDYQANQISGNDNLAGNSGSFDMGEMQACFEFSKFYRFKVKVVGGTITPPAGQTITGQISSAIGICKANGLYNANVNWNTNASQPLVTVSDPALNSDNYYDNDKIFSYSPQSNETVDWISPNSGYRFSLWSIDPSGESHSFRDINNNRVTVKAVKLYETWVSSGASCGQTVPPVEKVPSGNITATTQTKLSGQCLFQNTVSWTTQNVTSARVDVTDLKDNVTNVVGYNLNDTTTDTAWLQPDRSYRFTLYNTANGQDKLDSADVTIGSCGTTPPPVQAPSGRISASPAVKISGMCFFRTTVIWATQNVTSAVVEVTDMAENVTNVVGYNLNDTTSDTSWMQADRTYRFTLYNTANGKNQLAYADVTTAGCGTTPPPVCVVNTNYFLNAAAPVKQDSNYSVKLTWGSDGNNQIKLTQVNSNNSETALTTGANNGTFTTSANLQAGNTYTFKIYDANPECGKFLTSTQVVIQSSPSQLVCSADSSVYNVGQPATFRATGGTSPYTWTGNGQSFTGSVFTTVYTTSGNKNVIVFSNDGQTANCSTSINQPVTEKGIENLT